MTEENNALPRNKPKVFDIFAIAKEFPAAAKTMLIDTRLTDEPEASARVFRVYRPVPSIITPRATSTCWSSLDEHASC